MKHLDYFIHGAWLIIVMAVIITILYGGALLLAYGFINAPVLTTVAVVLLAAYVLGRMDNAKTYDGRY